MNPTKEELIKVIENTKNIHEVAGYFKVNWRTVKCWYRWKDIIFQPSKEQLIEDCKELLDKDIAVKYKVTEKTITKWKKEYNVSKKTDKIKELSINFTDEQLDLINGTLLGDAWIENINLKHRTKNCNYGLEHCMEQLEYLNSIHEILNPFSLPIKYRSRKNPFAILEKHKQILDSCNFNTKKCKHFTELRQLWYPNGIKVVPRDIDLNWRTIAFWYCDDGSNTIGKRCIRRDGTLCTNGFTEEDVEFLMDKLQIKGIKSHMIFDKEKPMIKLHKDTFMDFLNNVKPYIPWKCMQYKLKNNSI